MLSTCPSCLDMVNHEDHLTEVSCACGHKFSPFMDSGVSEEPPAPTPEAAPALTPEPTSGGFDGALLNETFGMDASPPPAQNFQESTKAFEELREFGEGLIPGAPEPQISVPPPAPPPGLGGAPAPKTSFIATSAGASDCLMTAGDVLQGYQVTQYLHPLSVVSDLNLAGGDPLRSAYDAIWNQAKAGGANGVVAVKWTITPDGGKVILSGTPVQCVKVS